MKNIYCLTLLLLAALQLFSQDTIVVQTFTFDSITARRGIFQFPDSTHSYRKILMEYTLKCDPATTHDGYNCGEWDYLTYTHVYDHTGVMDSTLIEHPKYQMVNFSLDTIPFTQTSPFSVNQYYQHYLVIDSIIDETSFSLGNSSTIFPLSGFGNSSEGRVQFYYSAADIYSAGVLDTVINAIKLNLGGVPQHLRNLTIRLKNSLSFPGEDGFENSGFTEVYRKDTDVDLLNWQTFYFTQDFIWDSISGILVDLSYSGNVQFGPITFQGSTKPAPQTVYASYSENYINISGEQYVNVDSDSLTGLINDEITISFWQYGDPEIQPQSDYIFEGRDANNKRVVSTHLPWSNGRVYWDAGNTGSSYDRIDKAASTSEYAGKWNHWAMTKNANTGIMRIYLNGILWHEGTGKTRTMEGITKFNIGASAQNSGFYDGYIDEFSIFNKELPDTIIQQFMNRKIDAGHPYALNLLVFINFDEGSGYIAHDISGAGSHGILMGAPSWHLLPGNELRDSTALSNMLADIVFVNGAYVSHFDSLIANDTIYSSPMSVVEYVLGNSEFLPVDTSWITLAGWQYVYNPYNFPVDSNYFSSSGEYINEILSYYEQPFEIIDRFEIGRFITPYGIGLDLGPDGFTWIYDVTDYAYLLKDNVDLSAGNQQELLDLKFLLIEGTPPRDVIEMNRPWGQRGSKKYSSLDGDISLQNKTIALNPQASGFKMKTRFTGHGHNSSTGGYPHCCEWKNNTHYLLVNQDTIADWHIWQTYDCAQNPVFPQGGTWPGAREGWCPGDKVKDFDFEITNYITGDSVDIDYDIEDVPLNNPGMGNGSYHVAMHFFQYGPANFMLDAEVVDIISPNNFGYFSRKNPVCDGAQIRIRNSGSTPLTSLTINYKVSGGTGEQFIWTGNLEFMQQEVVNLPISSTDFWLGNGDNIFEVSISSPNNGTDENSDNNQYMAQFELPQVYDNNFIVMYKSNNFPGDNYYEVIDINGNIVHSRYSADPNTTYYDTLNLGPGCYSFYFYDLGHDGLSYWAYPEQGTGNLRFKKIGGGTLKYFEPEFGYRIFQSFTLSENVAIHSSVEDQFVEVFPNPACDLIFIDIVGHTGVVSVQLIDFTGKTMLSKDIHVYEATTERIPLTNLASGAYLVRVSGDEWHNTKKILIQ